MNIFLNILLWVLAVFLLIVLIALFVKVKIFVVFKKQKGEKFYVSLVLKIFGGLFEKQIPLESKKANKQKEQKKDQENDLDFFEKVKKYYADFLKFKSVYKENSKRIRNLVYAEKIMMSVNFGVGDAAKTGILTGYAWAGIYNVVGFISKLIRIKEPKISITPQYNEITCELAGECIIGARPVNLIITALGIYKSYKKIIKQK